MQTVYLTIKGTVQGVWYRASAKKKADELGLTGWVKNCDDGSVECMVQGEKNKLKLFEEWCWQGPEVAEVKSVKRTSLRQAHYAKASSAKGLRPARSAEQRSFYVI